MPSHPRIQHVLDPIDTTTFPATEAAPGQSRPVPSRDDRPHRDAVWIRVGVPRRDPDDSSGESDDASGDRPDKRSDDDPSTVPVSEVESALDGLGVQVDTLGAADGDDEPDLQRVVDHYERLIAERDRAILDGDATTASDRGPLAAVRTKLLEITDGLRR